jgi:simple sugar transport system ATP-binding protein
VGVERRLVRSDEGQISVASKPVAFNSPKDAQALGIATVRQDLTLAADLSPFENLFLGPEIALPGLLGQLGFVNRPVMRRRPSEQFERLGVGLRSTRAPVSSLSGGQRQSVAIARAAMWAGPRHLHGRGNRGLGSRANSTHA